MLYLFMPYPAPLRPHSHKPTPHITISHTVGPNTHEEALLLRWLIGLQVEAFNSLLFEEEEVATPTIQPDMTLPHC